jgi:hypothetical protein
MKRKECLINKLIMKKIEVSDEMYDKLMDLSKEMTSQDPRCTKMPHMFQIQSKTREVCVEGSGEEIWMDEEGGECTEEGLKSYIIESKGWAEEESESKYSELEDYEIEEILDSNGYFKINLRDSYEYKNIFLTAKACQEHIDKNHYHYNDATVYLNHAWRNPEMELVSKFLCELTGGKLHT